MIHWFEAPSRAPRFFCVGGKVLSAFSQTENDNSNGYFNFYDSSGAAVQGPAMFEWDVVDQVTAVPLPNRKFFIFYRDTSDGNQGIFSGSPVSASGTSANPVLNRCPIRFQAWPGSSGNSSGRSTCPCTGERFAFTTRGRVGCWQ